MTEWKKPEADHSFCIMKSPKVYGCLLQNGLKVKINVILLESGSLCSNFVEELTKMGEGKDELIRFGVAFPGPLLERFDRYIDEQGYTNRSEAIRDLARRSLLEPTDMNGRELVAGTIVLVFDHHVSDLPLVLTEVQHRYHHAIISNMHVHLNHAQCLEVIVVRGMLAELRELHRQIQTLKGVAYAELSVTFVDEHAHDGSHDHR